MQLLEFEPTTFVEALGEIRTQLNRATVQTVRTDQLAEVPIWGERPHDGVQISGAERGEISADNATQLGVRRLEQGAPDVTLPVDWPLAAIGAEHHRQFIGGLCNDGYRPIHRLTCVVVQVRQQLDHSPPVNTDGGYRLDADVALSPQRLIVADKPSELSMAAHFPLAGVVNRHLAGPYFF